MAEQVRGMILAAGMGRRLRPLTYFRAKAAVPLLNRPLLSYSLGLLRNAGIGSIMINLHYLPESVRSAVLDVSKNIHFSFEREILGTAGCLRKVSDFLSEGTFVVSNAKIYFEEDLNHALDFHRSSGSLVTMLLVPYCPTDPFNPVVMDAENRILGFTRVGNLDREAARLVLRPGAATREGGRSTSEFRQYTPKDQDTYYTFTGVQILEPEVLDFIPPGASDTVNDIYPELMRKGNPIRGFVSTGYWREFSTPARYLSASLEILDRKGMADLWIGSVPENCKRVIAGESVCVPSNTHIQNCVLWNNIELGSDSSFSNVVITEGVRNLPANLHLSDAIVTPSEVDFEESMQPFEIREGYAVWPMS